MTILIVCSLNIQANENLNRYGFHVSDYGSSVELRFRKSPKKSYVLNTNWRINSQTNYDTTTSSQGSKDVRKRSSKDYYLSAGLGLRKYSTSFPLFFYQASLGLSAEYNFSRSERLNAEPSLYDGSQDRITLGVNSSVSLGAEHHFTKNFSMEFRSGIGGNYRGLNLKSGDKSESMTLNSFSSFGFSAYW